MPNFPKNEHFLPPEIIRADVYMERKSIRQVMATIHFLSGYKRNSKIFVKIKMQYMGYKTTIFNSLLVF